MAKIYVVTVNTPGYLPEGDPAVYYSREEAVEGVREEVEQILDGESQLPEGEGREVVAGSAEELYVRLERVNDPYDLGLVVEATEQEEE